MWQHRSKILTFKQAKWNWSKESQKAFDTIKKLISLAFLLKQTI